MTTCNNIILAQPEANTNVNYTVPEGDSARLNFSPDQISGLQMGENGELVVSFNDGGQLTITNFADLADSGNLVYLADGTFVDPAILTTAAQTPDAFTDVASLSGAQPDPVIIMQPEANTTQEVSLEQGMQYICEFNPANAANVEMLNGKMVLTFADGSQVIINNYETAMVGNLPAELMDVEGSVLEPAEFLTEVTGVTETLEIAELLELEATDTVAAVETVEPVEEVLELAQESIAEQVANVEPAAGEDSLAEALANIETASGEEGGATGNTGFGFGSTATDAPLSSPDAIGPLGATNLAYNAPEVAQQNFVPDINSIPTISFDNNQVDETDLANGSVTVTGQVTATYGVDTPGAITTTGMFDISCPTGQNTFTSAGVPIIVTSTPNGYVGAMVSGETVFTFEIDPASGEYTYEQSLPIDHPDSTDPNDEICIHLGIQATDSDGDSRSSSVQITIADDGPVVLSQSDNIVDETNFTDNGLSITGQFEADMGQDVGGSYAGNDCFEVNGSLDNGALTSNGNLVTVTFDSATNTYTAVANGETVFTLEVNPANGEYTYSQFGPLDHADATDPNDIINLDFGIEIIDFDGDTAEGKIRIQVQDDAPVTGDDSNTIDETNFDDPIVINDSVDVDFGNDGQGALTLNGTFTSTGSQANGQLTSGGVAVVVTQTANGYVGVANGVTIFTLEIDPTNGDYTFTLNETLDHADGNNPDDIISLNFGTIVTDYDGDSDPGTITINIVDGAPVANDDCQTVNSDTGEATGNVVTGLNGGAGAADDTGEGSTVTSVTMNGQTTDVPATGTVTVEGDHGVLTIAADGTYTYQANDGVGETNITTTSFDPSSADVVGTQNSISKDGITIRAQGGKDLSWFSDPQLGSGVGVTGGSDKVYGEGEELEILFSNPADSVSIVLGDMGENNIGSTFTYEVYLEGSTTPITQTVTIDADSVQDGEFTFDVSGLDGDISRINLVGGPSYVLNGVTATTVDTATVQDDFTYTITDADGDTSSAELKLVVEPSDDFNPIDINGVGETDDTDVLADGSDVVNGTINVNYQGDGPGTTTGNGSFGSAGNQTNNELTSNGVAVVVTFDAATNTYTGVAGTSTAFTMVIHEDGTYTFTQNEPLDHSNTDANNEALFLDFGVTATDSDGDTGTGTVRITVRDDAPEAVNDTANLDDDANIATGNVLDNDDAGADGHGVVCDISFTGGKPAITLADGSMVVQGEFGQLTINPDGSYNYERNFDIAQGQAIGSVPVKIYSDEGGTDIFEYTIKDADGDTSTATLTVTVADDLSPIEISGVGATDDTNLVDGPDVENGVINVNYQGDGPGTTTGNGSFGSAGNQTNNTLTSNGVAVVVTFDAATNTYTGVAGTSTAFTMVIHDDGTYTFTQNEPLDHSNINANNEALFLDFGVTATDSDGDTGTGTVRITVRDDAPEANDDKANVDSVETSETHCFDPTASDIDGTQSYFSQDGITLTSNNGADLVWVDHEGPGVGIVGEGTDKVFRTSESLELRFDHAADSVELKIGDMGANNIGNTFKYTVHLTDGTSIEETVTIDADMVSNAVFTFDVSGYGSEISGVDLIGGPSFLLNGVKTESNDFEAGDATGNVLANDDLSADASTTVTSVRFEGQNHDIQANGSTVIEGNNGTLTIGSNGEYSYDSNVEQEQQTVYSFDVDNPPGRDNAGDILNSSGSFNETTNELNFSFVISGQDANGFTLVLNDGPNPKNHPGELAILYFDASGTGEPIISAYGYNGNNGFDSFRDGSSLDGTQAPDRILGSNDANNPFTNISVTTDANGNKVFSFAMDATDIVEHSPLYGQEGTEWTGVSFDELMGIWFHPASGLETSYDAEGNLTSWNIEDQSWWDSSNTPTDVDVINIGDQSDGDIFEYTITDADGDTSTATLEVCEHGSDEKPTSTTGDVPFITPQEDLVPEGLTTAEQIESALSTGNSELVLNVISRIGDEQGEVLTQEFPLFISQTFESLHNMQQQGTPEEIENAEQALEIFTALTIQSTPGTNPNDDGLRLEDIGATGIFLNSDMPEDLVVTEALGVSNDLVSDAIGESTDTLLALRDIGDDALDISQMLETHDDITDAIQDFVHQTDNSDAGAGFTNDNNTDTPQNVGLAGAGELEELPQGGSDQIII